MEPLSTGRALTALDTSCSVAAGLTISRVPAATLEPIEPAGALRWAAIAVNLVTGDGRRAAAVRVIPAARRIPDPWARRSHRPDARFRCWAGRDPV
jgi:hypothetical protein